MPFSSLYLIATIAIAGSYKRLYISGYTRLEELAYYDNIYSLSSRVDIRRRVVDLLEYPSPEVLPREYLDSALIYKLT